MVEFSLTTAEHGRIINQKLIRNEVKYTDLNIDEVYALSIFNCIECGTFNAFLKDIKYKVPKDVSDKIDSVMSIGIKK